MTYDNRRRVRTIDAGTNLIKFTYDYAANSNNIDRIIFEYRPGSPYNQYTYDNLDRLTEADYLVGLLTEDETFGMDDLGNRTTVNLRSGVDQVYTTDTPNLTNRYTAVDFVALDYDAAGNLTQDHDGYHYVYDYENRVIRIYKLDGYMEINIAEYRYDALGRRIAKYDSIAHEMTLYYHNDEWQVLAEYDLVGHLRNFIYGNYIDEPLVMNDGSDDSYYAHDHLYSTVALIDTAGDVAERYEYDAYGKTCIMDAAYNPRTVSAYSTPYTFTGRHLDMLDSGMHELLYYRLRFSDSRTGRFLQQDPIQYVDGMNLYEHTRSTPLMYVDPFGACVVIGVKTCVLPRPIFTPKPIPVPIPITAPPPPVTVPVPPVVIAPPGALPIAEPLPVPITEPIVQPKPGDECHKPPEKKCLPCEPPVGTLAYDIDFVPPSRKHWPYPGSHIHYFNMNQSPPLAGCGCFWHEVGTSDGIIPWAGIPITPAAGGGVAP